MNPARSAGAPAIGVSADGGYIRDLVAQHKLVMHAPPKGTLELSLAYASVREVPAPGAR